MTDAHISEIYRLVGGTRLSGSVQVTGAKNSVLKLMAAALLAEGTSVVTNCPAIRDVPMMADVLIGLGCQVSIEHDRVAITVPAELRHIADFPAVTRLRASVCVLGPLMGRMGRAKVTLPGGDAIGSRRLDMHQQGLSAMGAEMGMEHAAVYGHTTRLRGADIDLEFPSVGATENLLMAAVLASGRTVIGNAAREPEIADLAAMLVAMGAKIAGAGTSTIVIDGVSKLHPAEHRTIGDRVVAGTWAYAAVLTQGQIQVRGCSPRYLSTPLKRLVRAGAHISESEDGFTIGIDQRPAAGDISTLPYPGFPTDLQPLALDLAAIADGTSYITENVFESRFKFVDQLTRLGAQAMVDGPHCVVTGVDRLSGAEVWSPDIRAGAALVMAALVADGQTTVHDEGHISRGYPNLVDDLVRLGAHASYEVIER